jgi:hypothetical protein
MDVPLVMPRRRVLRLGLGAAAGALIWRSSDALAQESAAAGTSDLEVVITPRPVYGGAWLPSTEGQHLGLDRTHDSFLAEYGDMYGNDYKLATLTSYVGEGYQVRYSAAYSPGTHGQHLRLGRVHDQFVAEYGELYGADFKLAVLSAYVGSDGALYYDAAYNPSTDGQYLRLHRGYDDFVADYNELYGLGYKLTAMMSNLVGGQVVYGGYFHPSAEPQYLRLDRSRDEFLAEHGEMWNNDYRLGALSAYVWGGAVYYNATYNPGTGGNFLALDKPHDALVATYGDMWGRDFRLAHLITESVEVLSPSRMVQGIRDRLDGNATGFSAVVASANFRVAANGGQRRTAADPPARASADTARVNIASVNKTITAVAALQAIAAAGLTIDDTVAGHLPTDWTLGANLDTVTFRELLAHTSGLRNGGATDYASMQANLAGDITPGNKTYSYQNQNFGLFRVIIPYLDGFDEAGVGDKDTATSDWYLRYVNDHIFGPCGIATVRARPEAAEPSLCYTFPDGGRSGIDWGDWTGLCGGGCLNLSADEVATFLVNLGERGTLLGWDQVETMYQDRLGWVNRTGVRHGQMNDHNGLLLDGGEGGNQIQLNSLACSFSSGVQAAIVINSPVAGGVDIRQAVIDAYNGSWLR